MKKIEYLLGIVLYNPTIKEVEKIRVYNGVFDEIVLFDNSTVNDSYIDLIKEMDDVIYITQSVNKGLSTAYNCFVDRAIDRGYSWLCTLDQDSDFSIKSIRTIKDYIEYFNGNNLGIVVPKVDIGDNKKLSLIREIEEINFAISSGMFINMQIIKENNIYFDESYFIDRVDADICKQVLLTGNKIIQCNNAILTQKLGEGKAHSHSSIRHYYISRNRWYYNKKYHKKILAYTLSITQTFKHIWLVIIHEKYKIEKISKIILGIRDYFLKISGKMVD